MADRNLGQTPDPAKLAETIRKFSIHGESTPFGDFGTSDFTDRRLCEASAICLVYETGMRGAENGQESEVELLIPEIRATAVDAIRSLIELALLSHRFDLEVKYPRQGAAQ